MIRGLYTAAAGIKAQILKNDVYAANLANVSTSGYRRTRVSQSSVPPKLEITQQPGNGQLRGNLFVSAARLDLTPGTISQTSNDLDLAINGQGFFSVETPDGTAFTRNGQFELNADGILINRDGYPVLGVNGPIQLASANISIDEHGQVYDGDTIADTLRVVAFDTSAGLLKQGRGLLSGSGERPATDFEIVQGAVEGSNVQSMPELQRMMVGQRLYEANIRALQAQDDSLQSLLDDAVG